MNKKGYVALIFAALLCLSACTSSQKQTELTKDIVVLYTNDVHCAVDDNIGYAGLAAFKKQTEKNSYVILADAGDAIQGQPIGTVSKGKYITEIMNSVGYDVAIPGNHEFDYGMDSFFDVTKDADFPYISSNFTDLKTNSLVLDSYKMFTYDDTNVAFVGVTTPTTITSSTPVYFQNENGDYIYGFCQGKDGSALYSAVQTAVDSAKDAGADYVILLAHLGIGAADGVYTSSSVISNTNGIDAVIDGHSHSVIECERVQNADGERVLLTSTGTGLENIGMLVITKTGNLSTGLISSVDEKDADTEKLIKSIKSKYEKELDTVVAKSDVKLEINDEKTGARLIRNNETNLGDLCADAYRYVTDADVAFVNGGGIRDELDAGDITYGEILNVHPYGNYICTVKATGQEILDALEMGARLWPEENGGFLQVSGLTYEIHTYIKSSVKTDENGMFVSVDGEYRVKNVKIGGKPLDTKKTYTVASHDYMLKNSGDGINMFADNTIVSDSVALDNQALITYITEVGVSADKYSEPDGRIIFVTEKAS